MKCVVGDVAEQLRVEVKESQIQEQNGTHKAMLITCPRCGFEGEPAFEFKTNPMLALLKETLGRGSSSSGSTARDEEIGEYTVCPQCISVYAVTTGRTDAALPHLGRHLTLLTAERLRRFSPEAQERLRARMEGYFKAHRDSSYRADSIEYLQKYIVEYLRAEERRRMRLSELTLTFVALSENHPFFEALERLQSRGRIHTWQEKGSEGETMVMLI